MRRNLADYIATERPVFPLTEISYDDMRENFYNLQKFDTFYYLYSERTS